MYMLDLPDRWAYAARNMWKHNTVSICRPEPGWVSTWSKETASLWYYIVWCGKYVNLKWNDEIPRFVWGCAWRQKCLAARLVAQHFIQYSSQNRHLRIILHSSKPSWQGHISIHNRHSKFIYPLAFFLWRRLDRSAVEVACTSMHSQDYSHDQAASFTGRKAVKKNLPHEHYDWNQNLADVWPAW